MDLEYTDSAGNARSLSLDTDEDMTDPFGNRRCMAALRRQLEECLTENRLLLDRFFAVRDLVEPYRCTEHSARDTWPLLDTRPDVPLTTAENERVKRLEDVAEVADKVYDTTSGDGWGSLHRALGNALVELDKTLEKC